MAERGNYAFPRDTYSHDITKNRNQARNPMRLIAIA